VASVSIIVKRTIIFSKKSILKCISAQLFCFRVLISAGLLFKDHLASECLFQQVFNLKITLVLAIDHPTAALPSRLYSYNKEGWAISINCEYRQTSVCNINIVCIFLLQYYHQGNIYRIVQYSLHQIIMLLAILHPF